MAEIVFGIGTSHSSQLSLDPKDWAEQAELDKRRTPWDDLIRHAKPTMGDELTPDIQSDRHERAQRALRHLARVISAEAPDVLLVVGDDQEELFGRDSVPAIAISLTDEMIDLGVDPAALQPIRAKAIWAYHGRTDERYPLAGELSRHVADSLNAAGFDLTVLRAQPDGRSIGHAWTFVRRRLVEGPPIPMVPIFLNTYLEPNRPTPQRCVALGAALAEAVESFPAELRVGFVASGGLSHFVVDEVLDNRIIDALKSADTSQLAAEPAGQLTSGTSEILNWITVGSALRDLQFELVDYIPAYRSPAGTGVGFAFGVWHAPGRPSTRPPA